MTTIVRRAPAVQLVYVSRIALDQGPALQQTVADILAVSHRRNAEDDITGMLVCNGAWFLQVLEGAAAAVEHCYTRIIADQRHHDVTLKGIILADSRDFADWAMCGLTLSPLDDALLTPPDIAFDVWTARREALRAMLKGLAQRHGVMLNAQHRALISGAQAGRRSK